MKRFAIIIAAIGLALAAFDAGAGALQAVPPRLTAPQPKPIVPVAIAFTQGTVTRTLSVPRGANCQDFRGTPINGEHGQVRFSLICSAGSSQSWVQFQADAGPIFPQWIWPAPACGAKPPLAAQLAPCPEGTLGQGFEQTHDWTCVAGIWQALPWAPAVAPPDECQPMQTFAWAAPRPPSTFAMQAKPAKGASYQSPYGTTVTRFTDHLHDVSPAATWIVSWYNRFQALNADETLALFYEQDGFWLLYDAHTGDFLKKLSGPAADAEINWDPVDPKRLVYVPTNGGTSVNQLDVTTNTHTVLYDFTAAVHALWPDVVHCWTKSEGSTSQDGRYFGFQCETANWVTRGFIKVDLVAKAIAWSMTNTTGDRPDNTTITPNGKWLVTSYGEGNGTTAYATDGSNARCQLHHRVEHAAIGVLSNGHNFYVAPDYQANGGPITVWDIDTCTRLDTHWPGGPLNIYNNPWLDNTPANDGCGECAMHPSATAYHKPGWILISFYGPPRAGVTPPAQIIVLNVETGVHYGLAAGYARDGDYWDEGHFFVNRDFTKACGSENWGTSHDIDVVCIDMPALQ